MSLILLIGCSESELPTPLLPQSKDEVFNVSESSVSNGQTIYFNLPSDGNYTLTLIDKSNGQVIGRERFSGKFGLNEKKIFTSSIEPKYLYLSLEDNTKKEIKKTIIILK